MSVHIILHWLGHPLQLTCFVGGLIENRETSAFYEIFIEISSLFDRQGAKDKLRQGVVVVVVVSCNSIVVTVCTCTYCSEKRHIFVV